MAKNFDLQDDTKLAPEVEEIQMLDAFDKEEAATRLVL